jgi:histidyl-tRNA synthetase
VKELGKQWYIRINSTEIIDGILQEGNVKLIHRSKVLKVLSQMDTKSWIQIKKDLNELSFIDPPHTSQTSHLQP